MFGSSDEPEAPAPSNRSHVEIANEAVAELDKIWYRRQNLAAARFVAEVTVIGGDFPYDLSSNESLEAIKRDEIEWGFKWTSRVRSSGWETPSVARHPFVGFYLHLIEQRYSLLLGYDPQDQMDRYYIDRETIIEDSNRGDTLGIKRPDIPPAAFEDTAKRSDASRGQLIAWYDTFAKAALESVRALDSAGDTGSAAANCVILISRLTDQVATSKTLKKYADKVGVRMPSRGGKGYLIRGSEATKLLNAIIQYCPEDALRERAQTFLKIIP